MEATVYEVICQRCGDQIESHGEEWATCPECGFETGLFRDKSDIVLEYRRLSQEKGVIVTRPAWDSGLRAWVLSQARMLLV